MKVFNLTDAATPAMKRNGMANNPIRIPGTDIVVAPGTSKDVPKKHRPVLQRWINIDCLSVDAVPKWYRGAARPKQAEPATTAPAGPAPDPKKIKTSSSSTSDLAGSKETPEVDIEVEEDTKTSSMSRRSSRRK